MQLLNIKALLIGLAGITVVGMVPLAPNQVALGGRAMCSSTHVSAPSYWTGEPLNEDRAVAISIVSTVVRSISCETPSDIKIVASPGMAAALRKANDQTVTVVDTEDPQLKNNAAATKSDYVTIVVTPKI